MHRLDLDGNMRGIRRVWMGVDQTSVELDVQAILRGISTVDIFDLFGDFRKSLYRILINLDINKKRTVTAVRF